MKRKRFPQDQLSLRACLKRIRDACDSNTLDMIHRTDPVALHDDLGRWIRNNCGLWKDGTEYVVADIITAYKDKTYHIESLDNYKFVHPDLPFDLAHACPYGRSCDRKLEHPDNCSNVIIEILIDILKKEHESANTN